MPDIAVFTKCVTSTGIRSKDCFRVNLFVEHKYFNSSGQHCNALVVVFVLLFFLCCAPTKTPSLARVLVDYTLRERQNLAFPIQNYISSILITSFTLDINLQKRWFPAQDSSVRITESTYHHHLLRQRQHIKIHT